MESGPAPVTQAGLLVVTVAQPDKKQHVEAVDTISKKWEKRKTVLDGVSLLQRYLSYKRLILL